MKTLSKAVYLFSLVATSCSAQVRIDNPKEMVVPEARVQVLSQSAFRVVADRFHVKQQDLAFPLVLVLGDPDPRYTADEEHALYTVRIAQWNEAQFTDSVIRLAVNHLLTREKERRLVVEAIERTNRVMPVSIDQVMSAGGRSAVLQPRDHASMQYANDGPTSPRRK